MTAWRAWLDDYFARYRPAFDPAVYAGLEAFCNLALDVRARDGKLLLAGNGASASLASHGAVDFTKQGQVRAMDFNEPNLITAFSNDFGYENWIARAIEFHAKPEDAVVLISVSGTSPNIVRAAEFARSWDLPVVGLSGKRPDNPLRGLATIDLWFDSGAYNIVEGVHNIWLTTVVDMVVGRAEYAVTQPATPTPARRARERQSPTINA